MNHEAQEGIFVVIEGLDGAGTTTQTRLLVERLTDDGIDALETREPSDGPIGVLIRKMLSREVLRPTPSDPQSPVDRQTLALLFAADRVDHVRVEVEPALRRGVVVVSDRYVPSSYVYQGDIDESDRFDVEWVRTLNERARQADLTFFLETPVETCLERITARSQDRDLFETREKLLRLHRRYQEVFDALEGVATVHRLDGQRPLAALHDEIRTIVSAHLASGTAPG